MKSKKEDRVSQMMLFCALMLVKNSTATLQQCMRLVPLSGNSKHLASALGKPAASLQMAPGAD